MLQLNQMIKSKFTLIEAPIYQGQNHFGVCLGPAFLNQTMRDLGFEFEVKRVQSKQSRSDLQLKPYSELAYLVEVSVLEKDPIFIVGGDHSLSFGSVNGLLRTNPNLKVIWVDAHGDINTRKSSLTGAFHGMPLSFLLGLDSFSEDFHHDSVMNSYLKPQNLIYFGVRDLDEAEKMFLEVNKIQHFSMEKIQELGLQSVIELIKKDVEGHQVHFSIDADAFDPVFAPATGVPVMNGLNYQSVYYLLDQVMTVSEVRSMDFVELNPQIFQQPEDVLKTAQIGIDLFQRILEGHSNRGEIYEYSSRKCDQSRPDLIHSNF